MSHADGSVRLEGSEIVLDILQVAANDLRKLIDRAWAPGSNRAEQREPVRGEQISCGLDAGEVDALASTAPAASLDSREGLAESLERLPGRLDLGPHDGCLHS